MAFFESPKKGATPFSPLVGHMKPNGTLWNLRTIAIRGSDVETFWSVFFLPNVQHLQSGFNFTIVKQD